MTRGTWITAAILVLTLAFILIALVREASRGPTFRAEDHPTLEACLRNIPSEWGPQSPERSGAEAACRYVHGRRAPR